MNGYIFDWDENSEKILNGEGYTTVGHQFMEQVALFRYLMDHGYTKDDVDKIWRSTNSILYQKTCGDIDEIERLFARIWGKAAKWKNNFKGNEIVIYQSEIDFINNMEVLPWIKQYVLTLLCVYKWWGREWCKYDKKIRTFCYSCTSQKKEDDAMPPKISACVNKYHPYELCVVSNLSSFKILFIGKGEICCRINNPREIGSIMGHIKNIKKCSVCNREYEYTSYNCRFDVCPDCIKKERYKKQYQAHKRQRQCLLFYDNEKEK